MRDFGNLKKLLEFARENAVSVRIEYSEIDDNMLVEVLSSAPIECYCEKRILNIDNFIKNWKRHIQLQVNPEQK